MNLIDNFHQNKYIFVQSNSIFNDIHAGTLTLDHLEILTRKKCLLGNQVLLFRKNTIRNN